MKKLIKLLSFASLAVSGIAASLAVSFSSNVNQAKEAKAGNSNQSYVYVSVDDPTWNYGNDNLLNFSYCFWEDNSGYYPYGAYSDKSKNAWYPKTFGQCVSNGNKDFIEGLSVELLSSTNGMKVIKLEVPFKSTSATGKNATSMQID